MTMVGEINDSLTGLTAEEVMAAHFTLIALPDAIEPIVLDGADGWTSPNAHPALSLMRWTTDNPDKAAQALDAVVDRFRDAGRGFDWMTSPRCAAAGLIPLLEDRGFINPALKIAAMARPIDLYEEPQHPEGIHIRKVDDPSEGHLWSVMAQGFDLPDDVAAVFHDAYVAPSPLQKTEIYAAMDSDGTPLGVGYLSYIGDGPAVLLRVSCTLEASRGRGVYTALVNQRLRDAALQRRSQAFVHAYSDESRRCLEQLGFTTMGELQLHRWRP